MNWLLYAVVCMSACSLVTSERGYPYEPDPEGICNENMKECRFKLIIEAKVTMVKDDDFVKPCKGGYYRMNDTNCTHSLDSKDIIQGDGFNERTRLVIVANNTMPGPTITVWEGQNVTIEVKNEHIAEGVTIHWHGVVQMDSNLMDGVAFVNQCPIFAGQTFTYKFKVFHSGSDFYHAHIGAQRTQGLFGALITKRRTDNTAEWNPERDGLSRDYPMIVNDWNHDYDSNTAHLVPTGFPFSVDGSVLPGFTWHSGLINGKGRFHEAGGGNNEAPLEVFEIEAGKTARFRVIGAGTAFPLRISIENHMLTMISTDGYEFEDEEVESFIINPGERYDFLLKGDQTPDLYWIYAESQEDPSGISGPPHRGEAILKYTSATLDLNRNYDEQMNAQTPHSMCTSSNPCNVLNCAFEQYEDQNTSCRHLTDLVSKNDYEFNTVTEFEEEFFNFGFPKDADGYNPGSINGRQWEFPPFSAASQKNELSGIETCDRKTGAYPCGIDKICTCTNVYNLTADVTYQFIFINQGVTKPSSHPIHLHGHNFYVVKQGFGAKDSDGKYSSGNHDDIFCYGTFCNKARWNDTTWADKGPPSANVERPILKDTVMVPPRGYTVIRFKANNPGFWYMHCHIELHNLLGMAMMFNEASDTQGPIPLEFPVCRDFDISKATYPDADADRDEIKDDSSGVPVSGSVSLLMLIGIFRAALQ